VSSSTRSGQTHLPPVRRSTRSVRKRAPSVRWSTASARGRTDGAISCLRSWEIPREIGDFRDLLILSSQGVGAIGHSRLKIVPGGSGCEHSQCPMTLCERGCEHSECSATLRCAAGSAGGQSASASSARHQQRSRCSGGEQPLRDVLVEHMRRAVNDTLIERFFARLRHEHAPRVIHLRATEANHVKCTGIESWRLVYHRWDGERQNPASARSSSRPPALEPRLCVVMPCPTQLKARTRHSQSCVRVT
jgi:hypothetical protein